MPGADMIFVGALAVLATASAAILWFRLRHRHVGQPGGPDGLGADPQSTADLQRTRAADSARRERERRRATHWPVM